MTKKVEGTKLRRLYRQAQDYRDAAVMLMSAMGELMAQLSDVIGEEEFVFPDGKRASTHFRGDIRKALNDFERRTNTAVLEFEWPSTVAELQAKRKEVEQDGRVDGIHQGTSE